MKWWKLLGRHVCPIAKTIVLPSPDTEAAAVLHLNPPIIRAAVDNYPPDERATVALRFVMHLLSKQVHGWIDGTSPPIHLFDGDAMQVTVKLNTAFGPPGREWID